MALREIRRDRNLSLERLKELLLFNPCTGIFTWKQKRNGRIAGYVWRNGYVMIKIDGVDYQASRLAWLYSYGKWPTLYIDHIDGKPSNNSMYNLRDVSHRENMNNPNSRRGGRRKQCPHL
jgi:hypothetical protein